MKPVTFKCVGELNLTSEQVGEQILDLGNWPKFRGYGPLPGIAAAEFETRTSEVVGTRIRVTNSDRSTHVEEIVDWQPGVRLQLNMKEFGPPLSRLATAIEEIWTFERIGVGCRATRTFHLHATSFFARPLVWMMSRLLKKAIARHLRDLNQ